MKKIMSKIILLCAFIMISMIIVSCSSGSSSGGGGCCSGCCGSDDASKDTNSDGNSPAETIPNTLNTDTNAQNTNKVIDVCASQSGNVISVSATKSGTTGGYSYSYTYVITVCPSGASPLGFNTFLLDSSGKMVRIGSGNIAYGGKETRDSGSYSSPDSFNRICVRTSGNPAEKCSDIA